MLATEMRRAEESARRMMASVKNGTIKKHCLTDNSGSLVDDPMRLLAMNLAFERMLKTKNYHYVLELETPQTPEL